MKQYNNLDCTVILPTFFPPDSILDNIKSIPDNIKVLIIDNSYDEKLYNKIKVDNYDVVVGNRSLTKKRNEGLKFYRLIISVTLIFIVNTFLGFKTNDPMSGFFAFRKDIYLKNKKKLFNRGYKILLDLIYSSSQKLSIIDVFIRFQSRNEGHSKINYKIIYFLSLIVIQKFILRIIKIFN